MALPALPQNDLPAHPKRDQVSTPTPAPAPAPAPSDTPKRRPDDARRLRRVKDSREQLKSRSRARGASNATIDTTTSNSTAGGRSYTVANVHNGVIYLRYAPTASAPRLLLLPWPGCPRALSRAPVAIDCGG